MAARPFWRPRALTEVTLWRKSNRSSPRCVRWRRWNRGMVETFGPCAADGGDGAPQLTWPRQLIIGERPDQTKVSTGKRRSRGAQGYMELNCYHLYGLTSSIHQRGGEFGRRQATHQIGGRQPTAGLDVNGVASWLPILLVDARNCYENE
jgi:hypothetical protein